MGDLTGKAKSEEEKMRCSLVLLVSLTVLLSIFLPAIEAAAARRRGRAGIRGAVSSSNRGRQQGRRGRVQARRGRQDADAAGADANAVDANAVDAESELPNGCDSLTEIGNFLSYPKLLMWCIEVGEIDPESLGLYKPLLAALEAKAAEEEAAEE